MSVFLMGCYDTVTMKWVTVAKCGNGHDDKALAKLQKKLKVTKIAKVISIVLLKFIVQCMDAKMNCNVEENVEENFEGNIEEIVDC